MSKKFREDFIADPLSIALDGAVFVGILQARTTEAVWPKHSIPLGTNTDIRVSDIVADEPTPAVREEITGINVITDPDVALDGVLANLGALPAGPPIEAVFLYVFDTDDDNSLVLNMVDLEEFDATLGGGDDEWRTPDGAKIFRVPVGDAGWLILQDLRDA
jgi:hypothetical protein